MLELLFLFLALRSVAGRRAKTLENFLDLVVLIRDELGYLLERKAVVFAWIIVFVSLGCLCYLHVLYRHFRYDVDNLGVCVGLAQYTLPTSHTESCAFILVIIFWRVRNKLSRRLVRGLCAADLPEAHDGSLLSAVDGYALDWAVLAQHLSYVSLDLLCLIRCLLTLILHGQILNVDRVSSVLYLSSR